MHQTNTYNMQQIKYTYGTGKMKHGETDIKKQNKETIPHNTKDTIRMA